MRELHNLKGENDKAVLDFNEAIRRHPLAVHLLNRGTAYFDMGDLEKAKADDRVKGNPLVIKGVATSGANKADVVIGNSDVMKIQSANTTGGVLRDCRVLFVLD